MKDVAEKANLALATVYRYCASKDHLFAAALAAWQQRSTRTAQNEGAGTRPFSLQSNSRLGSGRETVDAEAATWPTAARLVTAHMQRELRAFQRHPNFAILLRIVQSSSDPLANEQIAVVGRAHANLLAALLPDAPPERHAAMVFAIGSVFSVCLTDWSAGRMSIEQAHNMLEAVVNVLVREPAAG